MAIIDKTTINDAVTQETVITKDFLTNIVEDHEKGWFVSQGDDYPFAKFAQTQSSGPIKRGLFLGSGGSNEPEILLNSPASQTLEVQARVGAGNYSNQAGQLVVNEILMKEGDIIFDGVTPYLGSDSSTRIGFRSGTDSLIMADTGFSEISCLYDINIAPDSGNPFLQLETPTNTQQWQFRASDSTDNLIIRDETAGNNVITVEAGATQSYMTLFENGTVDFNNVGVAVRANASPSGNPAFQLVEDGSLRYWMFYSTSANAFFIRTQDSDGGGTPANVMRIPDGQLSVDFNTTTDENAFDYVCDDNCGWHGPDYPANNCPACGGSVSWHDDAELIHTITRSSLKDLPSDQLRVLDTLGIVDANGTVDKPPGEREVFIRYQTSWMFQMSAIAQLGQRVKYLERQLDNLTK